MPRASADSDAPSAPDRGDWLCLAALLLLVSAFHAVKLANGDIWEHLKLGEIIVKSHGVPSGRGILWTVEGHTWVAQSWLFEVVVYLLYRLGRLPALYAFDVLLIWAAFSLAYLWWRRLGGSRLFGLWLALLAVIATAPRYQMRPDVCTALGLVILLISLGNFKTGRMRSLWLLLPLGVLWANLHAGVFLGQLALGLFILAELLALSPPIRKRWPDPSPIQGPRLRHLLLISAGFVFAALLTPNGWGLYLWLFSENTRRILPLVVENYPLWQTAMAGYWGAVAALALLLLAVLWLLIRHARRAPLSAWLLLLVFAALGLRMSRQVWPLVAVALGVAALVRAALPTPRKAPAASPSPAWRTSLACCLLALVTAAGLADHWSTTRIHGGHLGVGMDRDRLPIGASDWLLRYGPPGRLFNTFGDSYYLAFRLSPKYRLFIDGFTDYPVEVLAAHQTFIGLRHPTAALDTAGVQIVILGPDLCLLSDFARRLEADDAWVAVFADGVSSVYLRRSPEYAALVERWGYRAVSVAAAQPRSSDPEQVLADIRRIDRQGVPSDWHRAFVGLLYERLGDLDAAERAYQPSAQHGNLFAQWRLAAITHSSAAQRLLHRLRRGPATRASFTAEEFLNTSATAPSADETPL